MKPVRVVLQQIYDFGMFVSLVGKDPETNEPLTIHVDHRPLRALWPAWSAQGLTQPILYDADNITLSLGVELPPGQRRS